KGNERSGPEGLALNLKRTNANDQYEKGQITHGELLISLKFYLAYSQGIIEALAKFKEMGVTHFIFPPGGN
ncbi:MAG: hypothetical protein AAFV07_11515, partial [Bacteroidota bacterium]